MGDITVRTDADLAGANPTYDLPAGELPTELPVYAVPDGEAEMRAALEDTAANWAARWRRFHTIPPARRTRRITAPMPAARRTA